MLFRYSCLVSCGSTELFLIPHFHTSFTVYVTKAFAIHLAEIYPNHPFSNVFYGTLAQWDNVKWASLVQNVSESLYVNMHFNSKGSYGSILGF